VRGEKPQLGVAKEWQVERAVTGHQSRISLERNARWWRFDEGEGGVNEVREDMAVRNFLLKLGEVSSKAREGSREMGTELRTVELTLHSNG
jgi:hypothetical protein